MFFLEVPYIIKIEVLIMLILEIASKIVPILLLIMLGMMLSKFRVIRQESIDDFKKIVVSISLPALLYNAFSTTKFETQYLILIVSVFSICIFMLYCGFLFARFFRVTNKYIPLMFSGFEAGMMGYALFLALFGAEKMYAFAIIDLGQVLFVFFVLTTILKKRDGESSTLQSTILSFIKSPVIIAIFSGIFFSLTGLNAYLETNYIGKTVHEVLSILSNLNVPLICLIIGFELKLTKNQFLGSLKIVLVRMSLSLLAAFIVHSIVIKKLTHFDSIFSVALFAMFVLPSPFVIPVFMNTKNKTEKQDILNILSTQIVVSLIAFIIIGCL